MNSIKGYGITQKTLNRRAIIKQLNNSNNNLEPEFMDQKNRMELSKSLDNLFNI
jgi:hypothetical protein